MKSVEFEKSKMDSSTLNLKNKLKAILYGESLVKGGGQAVSSDY